MLPLPVAAYIGTVYDTEDPCTDEDESLSTTEVAEEGTVDEAAAAETCGVLCSFFIFTIRLLFAGTFIDDGQGHRAMGGDIGGVRSAAGTAY